MKKAMLVLAVSAGACGGGSTAAFKGSGRADVQGTAAFALQDSDCWGRAPFAQVYFTSTAPDAPPPFGGQASGSVSSCAFSTAVFSSLTAP